MKRQIYQLTANDRKRISVRDAADYAAALAAFDANRDRLGRRFGLRKRDHALSLLRATEAYLQGKGQGSLDLANRLPYMADTNQDETFQNAYNLGYHTGYTERANLRDLIAHNPNFAHLRTSNQEAAA